jgi:hypothetical protein
MSHFRSLALASVFALAACQPSFYGGVAGVGPETVPDGMSPEAWVHALAAHEEAATRGLTRKPLLTIIDYSLPSTARRLWVVDVETGEIHAHEFVAHAVRSGGMWPRSFSNRYGSRQTSLGAFLTTNRYWGVRGLSLRLEGLEPGINDRARDRGIVLHGTPSVSAERARRGNLGRTDGCPAVSPAAARRLVPLLEDGVVLFAWYPDPRFMSRSEFVDRGVATLRLTASD